MPINLLRSGTIAVWYLWLRTLGNPCSTCGRRKERWTVRHTGTRKLRLSPSYWVDLTLVDDLGRPLAGEEVRVRLSTGVELLATLDEAGHLRVDSPKRAPATLWLPGLDQADVPWGPPSPPVTPPAWLELVVTDPDGVPAAGEELVVRLPDGAVRRVVLDARGFARLEELPAGSCTVWLPSEETALVTGATSGPAAPPADAWLELVVEDDAGARCAGEVVIVTASDGARREVTLDEQGTARLDGLAPGPCRVQLPGEAIAGPGVVRAAPPAPPEPPAWLELDAEDDAGAPLADEPYRVELSTGELREGRLDASGRARLEELPPGPCRVSFPERDAVLGPRVVVAALAPPPPPPPPRGWLELRLVDEEGQAQAGARWRVEAAGGEVREGVLDAAGQARLEDLPTGPARVSFPELEGVERP